MVIEGNDPSYEAYETPAYPSMLYHRNMVDRRGIEPLLEACKATVLPLSLPAHITYYLSYCTPQVKANLVPDVWFEQTTYRLQGDCTTAVLIRLKWSPWRGSNSRPSGPKPDALPDCATRRIKLAPQAGIEPTTN